MKNHISLLSDDQIRNRFARLARTERKITAAVVEYISEISRRDLHLQWGYPSLFEFLTREMGYSESAAYRRIQAARALAQIPEIKNALVDGSLKLSQVSQVQTALRKEEQATGEKIPLEARIDLFGEVAGKSGAVTQRILDKLLVHQTDCKAEVAHKRDESVELTLKLSKEEFQDLRRVKELYSHIDPHADWAKVVQLMTKDVIAKRDASKGKRPSKDLNNEKENNKAATQSNVTFKEEVQNIENNRDKFAGDDLSATAIGEPATQKPGADDFSTQGFSATEVNIVRVTPEGVWIPPMRKAIPAETKRLVFSRDKGSCQFRSQDGKLCGRRFQPEVDHIFPIHAGGGNEPENLQILCRNHNSFRYRRNA